MRIQVEQDVAVARAALLRALGVEDDRAIEVVAPPGAAESGESLGDRIEEAMAARPDLRSLEHRIEQAEFGVKLAASHRLPDIGVRGSYEWNGDALFSADGRNWAAGVGLRLPLFDGRETAARVARVGRGRDQSSGSTVRNRESWGGGAFSIPSTGYSSEKHASQKPCFSGSAQARRPLSD